MHWLRIFIDWFFGIGLFFNALLFIPQIFRLLKTKDSQGMSLFTFGGFCITQFAAVLYGFLHHVFVLAYGYALAFLLCGLVTVLAYRYRQKGASDASGS